MIKIENLSEYGSREDVPVECSRCGKSFLKSKPYVLRAIKRKRNLYCSTECYSPKKPTNSCQLCDEEFTPRNKGQRFCSRSCAAKHNNSMKGKSGSCLNCGTSFVRKKQKFCSHKCSHEYRWKEKEQRASVETDLSKVFKPRQGLKKYILSVRPHKCSICNISEWLGEPVPLVLDHEDGNSENNSIENLRLVCGNCNMNLPTFAGRNFGNGRHYRRVRYREGKSS